jgi:hypothetical protein
LGRLGFEYRTVVVAAVQSRTGTVAVAAHREKSLGAGLGELRAALAEAGHPDPLWYEVGKSRKASKKTRMAVKRGVRLVFVWGGDGMVRRRELVDRCRHICRTDTSGPPDGRVARSIIGWAGRCGRASSVRSHRLIPSVIHGPDNGAARPAMTTLSRRPSGHPGVSLAL